MQGLKEHKPQPLGMVPPGTQHSFAVNPADVVRIALRVVAKRDVPLPEGHMLSLHDEALFATALAAAHTAAATASAAGSVPEYTDDCEVRVIVSGAGHTQFWRVPPSAVDAAIEREARTRRRLG